MLTSFQPAILASLSLLTLAAAGWACMSPAAEPPSHEELLGKPSLTVADADSQLKHTKVVGALETPHTPGTSLLWCSTFQLAWNELAGEMNGGPGPLRVVEPCPLANQLNTSEASRADLDPASFVALAGLGQNGILDRIRKALSENFKGAASPKLLPSTVADGEILAYAYLFKNLEFETPFIRRKTALSMGKEELKSFGLWKDEGLRDWSKVADQIAILTYESPERWTVELRTKATEDRLIIARLRPGATLADTVKTAFAMEPGGERPSFEPEDSLIVPLMNFDVNRSFGELVGKTVEGSKMSGVIAYAKQNIRLKLDEKGAILKSEAAISVTSAMVRPKRPKLMICDGPFLMAFARKDAKAPYFAMWVENAELLERWK